MLFIFIYKLQINLNKMIGGLNTLFIISQHRDELKFSIPFCNHLSVALTTTSLVQVPGNLINLCGLRLKLIISYNQATIRSETNFTTNCKYRFWWCKLLQTLLLKSGLFMYIKRSGILVAVNMILINYQNTFSYNVRLMHKYKILQKKQFNLCKGNLQFSDDL